MEIYYRQYSEYDCTSKEIPKLLKVKSLSEKLPSDDWIKVLCFLHEETNEIVFVPYNSKIEIDKKVYEILKGELFVLDEYKELVLNNSKYFFQKDLCLKSTDGKMHHLRTFDRKEVRIL